MRKLTGISRVGENMRQPHRMADNRLFVICWDFNSTSSSKNYLNPLNVANIQDFVLLCIAEIVKIQ